jgi:hypothetical protein
LTNAHALANDDGYYLVLAPTPNNDLAEASVAEAASWLRLKVPELNRILGIGQPVPLGLVATPEEAALIGEKLRPLGIESVTVAHGDLRLGVAAKKIRALEVSDDSLTAIPTSGIDRVTARWDEVTLLVVGRLVLNRHETEERKRRGRKQLVDSRHLSTDEAVLDLYTRSCDVNWRISASNFDFSCLGSAKAITTFENFAALISLLRERAADAHFDDSYTLARPALASVWPVEQQTRKGEWRRSGAGKVEVATVTTTDNEGQFRRYSRLRRYLKSLEFEGGR